MDILQSWSHGLTLFKPANLKLFLLVTIKSIIETFKILCTKFWFVVVCYIVIDVLSNISTTDYPVDYIDTQALSVNNINLIAGAIRALGIMGMTFMIYLLVRPSVMKKDYKYVGSYLKHMLNYFLFTTMVLLIVATLVSVIVYMLVNHLISPVVIRSVDHFINILLAIHPAIRIAIFGSVCYLVVPFHLFFFLDSNGTFISVCKSFLRGLKMILYTLPSILIISAAITFMPLIVGHLVGTYVIVNSSVHNLVNVLLYTPIYLCFWNNFYIKNLRDNFSLYFSHREA